MRFLVRLDSGSWLLIYLIGERRKALFLGAVEKSSFLEEKGDILLSADLSRTLVVLRSRPLQGAHIIPYQLADLS